MSFPGAFPPVSLASFQAAIEKEAGDAAPVLPELFRSYELAHADPQATFFIDGGVLDNKPFGHAIGAITRRSAESEVQRRLLYLEPDPGGGGGAAPGGASPSPIATILASISGLPRRGARARRHPRGQSAQRARPANPARSSRRPSTRSEGGSRRSSAPSSIGSPASSRRPTSCSGAPGSTRTQSRPQASPTRPTSAAR